MNVCKQTNLSINTHQLMVIIIIKYPIDQTVHFHFIPIFISSITCAQYVKAKITNSDQSRKSQIEYKNKGWANTDPWTHACVFLWCVNKFKE